MGLKHQFQSIVVQGVPEQVGDFLVLHQSIIDIGGIETEAVLAGFFGLVHGRICIAHKLRHGGAIVRKQADTETGGNLVTIAFQVDVMFQGINQTTNQLM